LSTNFLAGFPNMVCVGLSYGIFHLTHTLSQLSRNGGARRIEEAYLVCLLISMVDDIIASLFPHSPPPFFPFFPSPQPQWWKKIRFVRRNSAMPRCGIFDFRDF